MKLGKKRLKLTFHQHPAGMFIKTIISVFSGFEPISNVLSRVILPQSGIAPQSGSIFLVQLFPSFGLRDLKFIPSENWIHDLLQTVYPKSVGLSWCFLFAFWDKPSLMDEITILTHKTPMFDSKVPHVAKNPSVYRFKSPLFMKSPSVHHVHPKII